MFNAYAFYPILLSNMISPLLKQYISSFMMPLLVSTLWPRQALWKCSLTSLLLRQRRWVLSQLYIVFANSSTYMQNQVVNSLKISYINKYIYIYIVVSKFFVSAYILKILSQLVAQFYYRRFDVWINCLGQAIIPLRPF